MPADPTSGPGRERGGDRRGPESPGGPFRAIEEGIAQLFASFEKGVERIAQAEGEKRSGRGDRQTATSGGAAVAEAAVPSSGPSSGRGRVVDGSDEEGDRALPPRSRTSYDEVLTPIPWRAVGWGFVLVATLFVAYVGATLLQVWAASDDDERGRADAIAVLGAAQFDGTPSPVLAARLDHALALWRDGVADVIVTTGANREGDRFTEGFSGYVHLREAGVPDEVLITIVDGADTYEQLSATKAQLDARDLDTVVVVSDGFHNHRIRSIAAEIGLDAQVSPTGVDATASDWLRETAAASAGRIVGYRRLSAYVD